MAIVKRQRWMIGICAFVIVAQESTAFLPASCNEHTTVERTSNFHVLKPSRGGQSLSVQLSDVPPSGTDDDISSSSSSGKERPLSFSAQLASMWTTIQLIGASLVFATLLIAWEDVSTTHPLRSDVAMEPYFGSTVRGLAFGAGERQRMPLDVEPEQSQQIPSYNEVMLRHRTKRVPTWSESISREDVERSVHTLQLAVLHILECERLASNYEREELSKCLRDPVITTELDEACDILNRAADFLSLDVRSEIGFDFGSCAWRHCGAFADVREAVDELDHLVGILGMYIICMLEHCHDKVTLADPRTTRITLRTDNLP